MKKRKKALKYASITAIWAAIWFGASYIAGSDLLIPTPVSVGKALIALLSESDFYLSVAGSVTRITAGFAAGTVIGILFGCLTYFIKPLKAFFAPLIGMIKATPVASFIILLFVWFSNSTVAAVTAMIIVIPVIWNTLFSSLAEVDGSLLEMAIVFGVKKSEVIKKIYIPSVMPALKAAVSTAVGLAWKAGIAAEVICSPKNSIGGGIYDSKIYLDIPSLFAWTAVVVTVSIIIEKIVIRLINRGRTDENES